MLKYSDSIRAFKQHVDADTRPVHVGTLLDILVRTVSISHSESTEMSWPENQQLVPASGREEDDQGADENVEKFRQERRIELVCCLERKTILNRGYFFENNPLE